MTCAGVVRLYLQTAPSMNDRYAEQIYVEAVGELSRTSL